MPERKEATFEGGDSSGLITITTTMTTKIEATTFFLVENQRRRKKAVIYHSEIKRARTVPLLLSGFVQLWVEDKQSQSELSNADFFVVKCANTSGRGGVLIRIIFNVALRERLLKNETTTNILLVGQTQKKWKLFWNNIWIWWTWLLAM